MSDAILSIKQVTKSYSVDGLKLEVLKGVDLDIAESEAVCIVGVSGAGKSTLLHILGTLDRPTQGQVYYRGKNIMDQTDDGLARFRNKKMGFVFQFHHLLPELTALENVALPARIGGLSRAQAEDKAKNWLSRLGLKERLHHYSTEMSGGEKQRVAIARALIQKPEILFADEPSGNLDSENGKIIQNLFFQLQKNLGITLVVVTHDQEFASRFTRVCHLKNGVFENQMQTET